MVDPSGWRRGWHDLRTGTVVVDVRPVPAVEEPEEEAPRQVVNLTAMRLVPGLADAARGGSRPAASGRRRRRPRPSPAPPADGHAAAGAGLAAGRGGPRRRAGRVRGRASARPRPSAPPAPPEGDRTQPRPADTAAPPARWQVTFDTGEQFEVRGLTLVGRRPEPRPGEPVKRLVTLPSDDMSLSKTHAQFQVVPDGALVVMDRGSTNGSILIRAGVTKRLVGGKPATLRDGDRVRFGDREMTVAQTAVSRVYLDTLVSALGSDRDLRVLADRDHLSHRPRRVGPLERSGQLALLGPVGRVRGARGALRRGRRRDSWCSPAASRCR